MPAIFRCSYCGTERELPGTGFSLETCAPCESKLRIERFHEMCPPLYRMTDESRLPQAQLRDIMAWENGNTGILAIGPTGTGKTRCIWCLIKRLVIEEGVQLEVFSGVSFGHELACKYRDDKAEQWLAYLGRVNLVFFDDLGKLKLTDRAEAELFGVIESRCANLLPTFATTNDTGDSIAARMTENRGLAFVRRLRDFCKIVSFFKPI